MLEEDKSKQKESVLFAEDVFPSGDVDLVIDGVHRQFDAHPKFAGVIHARDLLPPLLRQAIDNIRIIYNCNNV